MAKKSASGDYSQMDDGSSLFGTNVEDFDSWDSSRLAEFLSSAGLSAYKKMIIEHKITGKHAPLLSDDDMRDMGMIVVGDRLRFKQLMMTMGRKSKVCNATKSIWTGEEQKYYGDTEQFCWTCCGMVPEGTYLEKQLLYNILSCHWARSTFILMDTIRFRFVRRVVLLHRPNHI